jgi:hypothetical protein
MNATAQLVLNAHWLMSDGTRRAEVVTAAIGWGGGIVLAIAAGCHMHAIAAARAPSPTTTDQASFVDWSVDGTGEAVETSGALVMPEDRIMTHRPASSALSGGAEMQKP